MIGVGGWGGRNEKSGPYVRFRDGKVVLDTVKGNGGSHGQQHEFLVEVRKKDHPIMAGLPEKWLHATDELYDRLRGPAKNLTVLATAFADPKKGGSGEHEPMLMVIDYEKGRVFHTTLGHSEVSMKCVGFRTTFARGTRMGGDRQGHASRCRATSRGRTKVVQRRRLRPKQSRLRAGQPRASDQSATHGS